MKRIRIPLAAIYEGIVCDLNLTKILQVVIETREKNLTLKIKIK